jgi:NAD(P)-dependent dehydrogenase (short-subunit alcohol dehydrogenase family)
MRVEGKAVIVTGGASGIGRAAALLLASHGARVVIADRDPERARAVRDEIAGRGGQAVDLAVDIGDPAAVAALVRASVDALGRIDVLVHAAGICPRKPLLEMADDDWREVIRVNLDGTFYVTRDTARIMAAQQAGTMILITSDRGVNGSIDYAHYAASKGGTIALVKSLALALGRYGVTVNGLNPGLTDTPLARAAVTQWQDKLALDVLGDCSRPDDIAQTILFLAGEGGRYMTGQVVGTRMRHGA